ncbi:MAG: hypothetical protein IPJ65_18400 [Archangiaceae bacterium]|nr:hypothetical protein [Archangiaceae bacterium]
MRAMRSSGAMLLGVVLACGGPPPATTCVEGTSQACACTDGRMGAQVCGSGAFGECSCTGGQAGGGEAGGGTSGGAGGAGGGPPPGAKRIFVTETRYTGDLGGLTGADAKCASSAAAASLGGSWKAWLSTDGTDANTRIADVGPWYRLDGIKVFNNLAHLSTVPLESIRVSEQRNVILEEVWTGTSGGGMGTADTCYRWVTAGSAYRGTYGVSGVSATWTHASTALCSEQKHLYCLEQ